MDCESCEISRFLQVRFDLMKLQRFSAPEMVPDIQDVTEVYYKSERPPGNGKFTDKQTGLIYYY